MLQVDRYFKLQQARLAEEDRKAAVAACLTFEGAVLAADATAFAEWLKDPNLDVNKGVASDPRHRRVPPIEWLFSTHGSGVAGRGRHSRHRPTRDECQKWCGVEWVDVLDLDRTIEEKQELRRAVEPMLLALVRHPRFNVATPCVWAPSRCLLDHAVVDRLPSMFAELLWLGAADTPLAPQVQPFRTSDVLTDKSETLTQCLDLLREHDQKGAVTSQELTRFGLPRALLNMVCAYVGLRVP